jgi:hypothetical protein
MTICHLSVFINMPKMKVYQVVISLFLVLSVQNLKSQNIFSVNPVIGIRLHQLDGHGYVSYKYRQIASSPLLGLEIRNNRFPFVMSYRFNYAIEIDNLRDSVIGWRNESSINAIFREQQIDVFYILKNKNNEEKLRIGLGHIWEKKENYISHAFDGVPRSGKSITLSFMLPVHWFKIEFKEKIEYSPDLAVLDKWKHSINFLYDFSKHPKTNNNIKVNFLTGLRAFPILYKNTGNERFDKIGISAQLGLEFFAPKFKTSFNMERDWWIAFNGGSPNREIKGHIATSIIGLRYHYQMKNQRNIKFGIGASYITDNEQLQKERERIFASGSTPPNSDLVFYNLKGMAASISYPISDNIDSELRHTFVLKGNDKYSFMRTSLGIIYRLNLDRNKSL